MRHPFNILITFSIFFCFPPAFCQQDIPAALKLLLKDRIDAMSNKDTSTLSRVCTKNYLSITSAGVQMTLPELKKAALHSETPVKQSTILSFQPFIAEDETMAFATYEMDEEIVRDRQDIVKNDLIITEIYKKEKNRWKTQLTHTSQKICDVPVSDVYRRPAESNHAGEDQNAAYGISLQPRPALHDTLMINIPNAKGQFSRVKLVRCKEGYLGPQGELYSGYPTVGQLEVLYGE